MNLLDMLSQNLFPQQQNFVAPDFLSQIMPTQQNNGRKNYGMRIDNTPKGPGFMGELARPGGGFSTELSMGVNIGGKEILIPAIVPTLTEDELDYLLKGGKPTKEIIDKAVNHAVGRMNKGLSPFKDWDE